MRKLEPKEMGVVAAGKDDGGGIYFGEDTPSPINPGIVAPVGRGGMPVSPLFPTMPIG